ncbi:tetratricopeptide repeat protein [Gracilibacillus oryzae]|uniref:tetratricopeptide repeat protein n=1 Tax=Gracilibacillus oryzae TaxID=1672701 RepID=UPI002B1BD52C|nr:tetratricopeptide repeat protein [Gracilibacillus oryzae]
MPKPNQSDKNVIPFIPDGEFYFTKGVEAYQKQKFELSLKWFRKALSEKPDHPLYQCQMSIVYTEIGSYHKANQLLTRVLTAYGEEYIDCYYLIANNYAHLGLLQDAIKYAELYLDKDPEGDFAEEAIELITVLDFEEDEEDDDWALDEEDEVLIYQETVFYHLEREEWQEAIALLEEMIALFPDFPQARHEYHYALFFAGETVEAIDLEEKYVQDHPETLNSYMNLAIFYYHTNKKAKFDQIVTMLQNIYPVHEQQKLRMATTFTQIGFYEEALLRFKLLHKSRLKGHPSYYRWFSTCYYFVGNEEKAEAIWLEGCKEHTILTKQLRPWKRDKLI